MNYKKLSIYFLILVLASFFVEAQKIQAASTCTDSDGGLNYFLKGSAIFLSEEREGGFFDCCKQYNSDEDELGDFLEGIGAGGGPCLTEAPYLYEAICENGIPVFKVYQCSYGCLDGACQQSSVNQTSEETTTPSEETTVTNPDDTTGTTGTTDTTTDATTDTTTVSMPTETTIAETIIEPSQGGQAVATTNQGNTVRVDIPVQAVNSETTLTVTPIKKTSTAVSSAVQAVPIDQNVVGGFVYQFEAKAAGRIITSFGNNLTITLTYTNEQIAGLNESTLTINYWKEDVKNWSSLTTNVNAATNTLTAFVDHFTYFAILGEEAIMDEDEEEIAELQAEIVRLTALIAQLQATLNQLSGGIAYSNCSITGFKQDLFQGMSSDDVKCLQIILNSAADTQLALTGPGSSGNETNYFGPLTTQAVIKFQNKYKAEILTPIGLSVGTGYVGSMTKAKLNQLIISE